MGCDKKYIFILLITFLKKQAPFSNILHPIINIKVNITFALLKKNYFIVFLRLIIVKVEIYFLILYLLFFVNADAYFEQFMPYQQDEFLEKRSPLFKLDKEIYRYKKSANQNLNVNRFLSFFYRRFRYG